MNFQKALLLTSFLLLQSCATEHLESVPDLGCNEFDALNAGSVKVKSVSIEVKDEKRVNQRAGNASAVSARFADILACIAEKGGFKVAQSPNHWTLTLTDCDRPAADTDQKNSRVPGTSEEEEMSCVKMKTDFVTTQFRFYGESTASQGYTVGNSSFVHNGEIIGAYREALRGIMLKINEKLKQ